jgi:hypothetical protein
MVMQIPAKDTSVSKVSSDLSVKCISFERNSGCIQCLPAKKMTNSATIKTLNLLPDLFENLPKYIAVT